MFTSCVIGASGYTGMELCRLLSEHPDIQLSRTFVSENSLDGGKRLSELHPVMSGKVDLTLDPLSDEILAALPDECDFIFLATPHQASHDWMPILSSGKAKVLDLSGAFRLKDQKVFEQFYGFPHTQSANLENARYGLVDFYADDIRNADIIAVPGCYPTASLYALKPLAEHDLLSEDVFPVINAVSGVSGAGRKASLTNSFCEVSLQAYGVLQHRHQPEITAYLGRNVIFTPHLGDFKRGILATVTAKVASGVSINEVNEAYQQTYQHNPLVRLLPAFPRLDDVVNTPCCDLHWKLDPDTGYLVIGSAIDNLLKGAASQAVQCANLLADKPLNTGLWK